MLFRSDLPTEPLKGLTIAGVSERENPCELLLIRKESVDASKKFKLRSGAVVGTSSTRRKSQLLALRPDCSVKDLRGNVPTRIQKLRDGNYDAILIAFAGLARLNLNCSGLHEEIIPVSEIVPAPAQGVLAWQIRENDSALHTILQKLSNEETEFIVSLERKVLNLFDGGCQLPLGVYCEQDVDSEERPLWKFHVAKAEAWDKQPVQLYFETHHPSEFPEKIVRHIQEIKPKKVFITKNLRTSDYLFRALTSLTFEIEFQSLIDFKMIPFAEIPATDWIFFSSKHAVAFFFRQKPAIGKAKIGCIGKATAQALREFGFKADFIGQNTDTRLIGKQFSALAGKSRVLFPMAKESLQSVQHQLVNREQAINLPVYATLKNPTIVSPDTEVVVFTSPSNADAFFEKNKWTGNMKAVAMGDATAAALQRKEIGRAHV